MEPEGLLLCLEEPATGPCLHPNASILCLSTLFS